MTGRGGAGSKDLDHAIATLRARIDEEFRISERLDTKGRQAFALAAAFFAVVQTVTFGSFAQSTINHGERVGMLIAAVAAGAAVAFVAFTLVSGEKPKEQEDVKPEFIVKWLNEAGDNPEYVSVRLVSELSRIARGRANNNATRTRNYDLVAAATLAALVFAGTELIVAIAVRL